MEFCLIYVVADIGRDLVQDLGDGVDALARIFCRLPKMRNLGDAGDSLSLGTKCGLSITV